MTIPLPITYEDVVSAAELIASVANPTPVLTSRTMNAIAGDGAEVFFKCENYQRVGAFKFRGAYNHLARLTEEQRRNGVVAASSGNHAQGVALAAQLLGIAATILMPDDAPASKAAATRGYGATVRTFDRLTVRPEDATAAFSSETGAHIVPSFDDPHIMAGQGTAAKELIEECGPFDLIVAPLGGGGLLAGTITAVRALCPEARVVGIEPVGADDWVQSLARGERVLIDPPATIADGVRTRQPGVQTFAVIRTLGGEVVTVTDDAIREATRFMALRMKTVVEPTGAIPAAAIMSGALGDLRGKRVGCIVSGGNVDGAVLAEILAGA